MRTVMTQCVSFPNLEVKHCSSNDASKLFIFELGFSMANILDDRRVFPTCIQMTGSAVHHVDGIYYFLL